MHAYVDTVTEDVVRFHQDIADAAFCPMLRDARRDQHRSECRGPRAIGSGDCGSQQPADRHLLHQSVIGRPARGQQTRYLRLGAGRLRAPAEAAGEKKFEVRLTRRWREMDSNLWYRNTEA